MMGQVLRPFDAVLTATWLELEVGDAASISMDEGVVHIGAGSRVIFQADPQAIRASLEAGYVVIYIDPRAGKDVVLETPFGKLTASPDPAGAATGWFSVRHQKEEPGVRPGESVFAAVEGTARAEGTAPITKPHQLSTGQEWRILQGRVPGSPQEGDARQAAEELSDLLHRGASDFLRSDMGDDIRLAAISRPERRQAVDISDIVVPEDQLIVDNEDAFLLQDPTVEELVVVDLRDPRLRVPQNYAAGDAATAEAQFYGYPGPAAPEEWMARGLPTFSDAEGQGLPAFQPQYLEALPNAGFSYLQFVGDGATAVNDSNGELFFVGSRGASGWALFTPQFAVADSGYQPNGALAQVVSDGLEAIAQGGTIMAFVVERNDVAQLADPLPVGYPHLDQYRDADDEFANDQLAALGAGLDPRTYVEGDDPRLLFISTSSQDGQGLTGNLAGNLIEPTDLGRPTERTGDIVQNNTGFAALGNPVGGGDNTVGVQFVPRGEVLAIIHHDGRKSGSGTTRSNDGHFEIERHERHSIIRWVERVGALELEDLNANTQVRNEFFVLLCGEVLRLTPPRAHTACGPAHTGLRGSSARLVAPSVAARSQHNVQSNSRRGPAPDRHTALPAARTAARPRVAGDNRGTRVGSSARGQTTKGGRGR